MTSAASVVTLKLLEDGSGVAHGLTVPQSQLLLANEIIQSHVGRTTALEHGALRLVLAGMKVPTFGGHLNQSNTG